MKKFTLVELLVVISIIGVLAGILLPVVSGSRQRTMVLKAKTDITNLTSAINKYESAYGKLPIVMYNGAVWSEFFDDSEAGERGRLSNDGYDVLVQILSGIDIMEETIVGNDTDEIGYYEVNDSTDTNNRIFLAVNPRKTQFLDVPNDFPETGFVDPWGNRYIIYFDYELSDDEYEGLDDVEYAPYDKKIEHPVIVTSSGSVDSDYLSTKSNSSIINSYVAVYSLGPNFTDEGGLGNDVYEGADDINSWSAL